MNLNHHLLIQNHLLLQTSLHHLQRRQNFWLISLETITARNCFQSLDDQMMETLTRRLIVMESMNTTASSATERQLILLELSFSLISWSRRDSPFFGCQVPSLPWKAGFID
jgi:hypothetical protein